MNRNKTLTFIGISLSVIVVVIMAIFFLLRLDRKTNAIDLLNDLGRKPMFATVEARIKTIELGFTKEQVKSVMGEPLEIVKFEDRGLKTEIWIFPHSKVASEPPRCVFDKESGKVIEVVCGDNYRIAIH
jgi:hypothetical protein